MTENTATGRQAEPCLANESDEESRILALGPWGGPGIVPDPPLSRAPRGVVMSHSTSGIREAEVRATLERFALEVKVGGVK
jgi:hypothetical protein